MGLLRFYGRIKPIWAPFTRCRPSLYAAGAGFYLLLSVLPSAGFLLGLLSRFPAVAEKAMAFLRSVVPADFFVIVEAAAAEGSGTAVLLISLWSASKGIPALTDGFRAVLELPVDSRGFFQRRLTAAVQFLALALCPAAVLLLPVGSPAVLWAGIWLLYSVLPGLRLPLWSRLAGSAAAAAGWLLFSGLFSLYLRCGAGFSGGLGFLVLLLIWLHSCILLLLYGAILAKLLAEKAWNPIKILLNALFPPCS